MSKIKLIFLKFLEIITNQKVIFKFCAKLILNMNFLKKRTFV